MQYQMYLTLAGLITANMLTAGCCDKLSGLISGTAGGDAGTKAATVSPATDESQSSASKEHERVDRCIKCFNSAVKINNSGRRYLHVLRGKEPNKGNVPFVVSADDDAVKLCKEALSDKNPPLPDIDRTLPAFVESVSTMTPLLKQMSGYYRTKEYETDNFAKGKTFHTTFLTEFEKYGKTLNDFEKALDVAADNMDKEQIKSASKKQNLYYHVLVFQHDAKLYIRQLNKDTPDADELARLKTAVDASFVKLTAYADAHADEVDKALLYTMFKSDTETFIGAVRSAKGAKPTDREASKIQDAYNSMIRKSNNIKWR